MNKNLIVIVGFIIGTGIFVSSRGGTIPYALFFFSLFIPFTSLIYIMVVWSRFKFYETIEKKVIVKGESVDYYFSIGNEDKFLYSSIKVYFLHDKSQIIGLNEDKEYCLMPGDKEITKTKICCKYRGEYYTGVDAFVISDYINLFNITYKVASKLPVTVLPRIIKWKNSDIIEEDKDEKNTKASTIREDQIDVQVKKYVRGESMRQIHWKASAKNGELMTRIYHSSVKREVMILIDLSPVGQNEMDKLLLEDCIIEEALAAANYCYEKNIPFFVCFEQDGYNRLPIQNIDEWNKFYLLCGKLLFHGKYKNNQLCEASRPWVRTVKHAIIVTHELNSKLYDELKSYYGTIETSILLATSKLTEEQRHKVKFFAESGFMIRVIEAGEGD
ncbi:DUF58 domain-containing protein [Clostridium sp. C2-6-12]|uniref:DUF58 domain-containing protein n=1 Tax=Clostridium sp. C2-6-12 TaxID=2698832 RepID=UPI001369F2F0|nr:DUF58 domain-containing protein [Clostridium sp. C2-6-12]